LLNNLFLSKKAMISLEFLLALLIIIITLFLFITINLSFKEKLTNEISFKKTNNEICNLKQNIIEKNNGEIINDSCKRKESTDNDS
jgi:predicted PurR-regulated permease PerM